MTARSLLVSAADATERLMSSWKEITELAGYTFRVSEMVTIFSDLQSGKYVKNVGEAASAVLKSKGDVIDGADIISLDCVPIVTPNGDMLVQELSFTIRPGMHLLITGPK